MTNVLSLRRNAIRAAAKSAMASGDKRLTDLQLSDAAIERFADNMARVWVTDIPAETMIYELVKHARANPGDVVKVEPKPVVTDPKTREEFNSMTPEARLNWNYSGKPVPLPAAEIAKQKAEAERKAAEERARARAMPDLSPSGYTGERPLWTYPTPKTLAEFRALPEEVQAQILAKK